MRAIAVVGAAGAVGKRVVRQMVADDAIEKVIAIDRADMRRLPKEAETHRVDIEHDDISGLLEGAASVIHLVEVDGRRDDSGLTIRILDRVLEAAERAEVPQVTVLSTALVYGAHADNPVPMSETHVARPNSELAYAVAKYEMEERALEWAAETGMQLCIVRPTTTLSEGQASWIGSSLRAATAIRPAQIDPPVQFLHHDDLASALALIARRQTAGTPLNGIVNVAPDGWIGTEDFRELVGGPPVRLPAAVSQKVLDVGRRYGWASAPEGIEAYTQHAWVVANDRLRRAGWVPAFSNEEAFVAGTPAPPWAVSAQRRQEIALAAAGVGVAGAAAVAGGILRRLSR